MTMESRIMSKILALAGTALLLAATPAFAESARECTTAPKSQWMSQDEAKSKAEAMGYEVRRIKVEDSCYEVYAIAKGGKRSEILRNPVTGEIVGNERNG